MDYRIAQEPIDRLVPDLGRLFRAVYPGFARSDAQLAWKYLSNPAGKALTWVAREKRTDLFCGCILAMPWELVVHGEGLRCVQVGDLMVHPAHRRKGLSLALFAQGMAGLRQSRFGLVFAFVQTGGPSHRGVHKFGAHAVGDLRALKRVLRPSYLAEKYLKRPFGGERLDRLWLGSIARRARRFPDFSLAEVERLDDGLDELFERSQPEGAVCARRGAGYVNWRHRGAGSAEKLFALQRGGGLEGYAAVAFRGELAELVDFYPWQRGEAREALFALLVERIAASGARLLQTTAPRPLRGALRRKGLVDRGGNWSLIGVDITGREMRPEVWSGRRWFMLAGDCDVAAF